MDFERFAFSSEEFTAVIFGRFSDTIDFCSQLLHFFIDYKTNFEKVPHYSITEPLPYHKLIKSKKEVHVLKAMFGEANSR